ncbi:GntR family transcriptional regulator [Marivita hallyeonensis]|uniref:Transcriptional regulator, GntR family n=1 Tax=Marivita hallyeonensis TaxID=996342 RepID=A0A1M5X300_9RHOB|nr:GntR family transcriptional regulator [Marivita hallyeonensis]SHH94161.1 transcriptional regulator, GntR family [Marivita hallyeonensis]
MTIIAHSGLPEGGKARRVYLLLRDEISNGVFKDGTRLPGEHKLADMFDVSRITVRRALEALAADGWIEKKTGAGSVVRAKDHESQKLSADFATLIPHLVEMDRTTTARLLSFSYDSAPPTVAKALELADGAEVQKAVRVRSSGGQPFSHLTTYVPKDIAINYDEADLATQPLFRLLERSGVSVESAHQSVTAALATPDVAEALEISVGSPLLFVQRIVRDARGRGVEHLSALYRPDLFRLEMDLARVGAGEARHWEPVIGGAAL